MVFFCTPEVRDKVISAIEESGGNVLNPGISRDGLKVSEKKLKSKAIKNSSLSVE